MLPQNLTAAQWQNVFELLDTALDLPVAERTAWLDALAEPHASLRPALHELLEQHARLETNDFLRRPPEITLAESDRAPPATDAHAAGSRIGPYRLVREL